VRLGLAILVACVGCGRGSSARAQGEAAPPFRNDAPRASPSSSALGATVGGADVALDATAREGSEAVVSFRWAGGRVHGLHGRVRREPRPDGTTHTVFRSEDAAPSANAAALRLELDVPSTQPGTYGGRDSAPMLVVLSWTPPHKPPLVYQSDRFVWLHGKDAPIPEATIHTDGDVWSASFQAVVEHDDDILEVTDGIVRSPPPVPAP
jgi:hypothetical protein